MAGKNSEINFAYLNQLSVEELETILYAELQSPEDGDSDMIDYILGVIVDREQANGNVEFPDVERTRQEFDDTYRDLENPLYGSSLNSDTREQSLHTEPDSAVPPSKIPFKSRNLRSLLIVAILITLIISMTTIPVLGYSSVIEMVAQWTAEQFSFQRIGNIDERTVENQSRIVPEKFETLQSTLENFGVDNLFVPSYIPEGFEMTEPVMEVSYENKEVNFSVMYENEPDYIIFDAIYNCGNIRTFYEKDNNDVEVYTRNEVEFYIFSNNGDTNAAWCVSGVEYSLGTTLPISDLKKIINSIC